VVQAIVMCWLRIPKGQERAEMGDLVQRMGDSVMEQMTGRNRSLLGGVVTAADADAASVFDLARHVLGNPYEEHPDAHGADDPGSGDEPADGVDGAASTGAEAGVPPGDGDGRLRGTRPPFPA
jgi:hypothetical protein